MQQPIDYRISLTEQAQNALKDKMPELAHAVVVFRMFEGGCKSNLRDGDYLEIVKQLFLAHVARALEAHRLSQDLMVERLPGLLGTSPDLLSYNVVAGLGSQRLRILAGLQMEPVRSWMIQEADILELED